MTADLYRTPHYSRSKDLLKEEVEKIRKAGFKAYIKTEKPTTLRGKYSPGGYSVYADRAWWLAFQIKNGTESMKATVAHTEKMRQDFEKTIADQVELIERWKTEIAKLETELATIQK